MKNQKIKKLVWEKETEQSFRQEFEQSLPERIRRLSELNVAWMIPNHHFAPASAECILLYRDGHYHGCISLVQAVTEAVVRFICRKSGFSPRKNYETNIRNLMRRGFISNQIKNYFLKIWDNRNDYHHLNENLLKEKKVLESLAKEKINLLHQIQQEIFGFNIRKGKVVPKHPEYWDADDGMAFIQAETTTRWIFK